MIIAIAALFIGFLLGLWARDYEVRFLDRQLSITHDIAMAAIAQGTYLPMSSEWLEREQEVEALIKKLAISVGIPEDELENL